MHTVRQGLLSLALAIALSPMLVAPQAALPQTQGRINESARREYEKTDADLNRAYKRLLPELDPVPRSRLVKAQRAWISFRDAEALFRASLFEGGTAEPAAYWTYLAELTERRTKDLKQAYKDFAGN